jgi:intracellular sulfur oxidation DsrE/DsrF family protein
MRAWLLMVGAAVALAGCAGSMHERHMEHMAQHQAKQPVKVVYHLTNGIDEAQRAMGNIRNLLAVEPNAKVVVVSNALGIDFMLDGAKDRNGNPFDASIQDLKSKGVDFRACNTTLNLRKIDRSRVLPEISIVDSGVAEAARLQAREGYAYLRP